LFKRNTDGNIVEHESLTQHVYYGSAFEARYSVSLLEKGMAIYSSIPAWRIPWTEEPGIGLQVHGMAKG